MEPAQSPSSVTERPDGVSAIAARFFAGVNQDEYPLSIRKSQPWEGLWTQPQYAPKNSKMMAAYISFHDHNTRLDFLTPKMFC